MAEQSYLSALDVLHQHCEKANIAAKAWQVEREGYLARTADLEAARQRDRVIEEVISSAEFLLPCWSLTCDPMQNLSRRVKMLECALRAARQATQIL